MFFKYNINFFVLFIIYSYLVKISVKSEIPLYGDIYQDMRNLRSYHFDEHKCQREIPAVFFQISKNEPVRGNGSTIYFNRMEVCCDGYVRSKYDWNKCIADCSLVSPNNCRNGFCRSPNKCICFDEFVRNDRGECVHTCPISCQNGRCYLNGTCICNSGYSMDPATRKYCKPDCLLGCGTHQECIAPGKCACKDGYRQTINIGCQPICTPDCGHGKCVGPNQCECFAGFMKRPHRNVCEAECYIHCDNGFCESRYKCQCHAGYIYDNNTTSCLPNCEDNCENGVCVAPGVCKCFEGFKLKGKICTAVCHNGCGYFGKCIEPNICACGASNHRCLLGDCNTNGRCICPFGLTHFVDKCVRPHQLEGLVGSYEQRLHYNRLFKMEFEGLIGSKFHYH